MCSIRVVVHVLITNDQCHMETQLNRERIQPMLVIISNIQRTDYIEKFIELAVGMAIENLSTVNDSMKIVSSAS